MDITFYKYQGTGNDFVMIDNRQGFFPKNNIELIAHLCDRRFGIGGDGLILLENDVIPSTVIAKNEAIAIATDFRMVYYNSDGNPSSMCGNGGRCLVAFAKKLEVIKNEATFMATDGLHYATIDENGIVSLQMIDVDAIKITPEFSFLDTGSPHHVQLVEDVKNVDVKTRGAFIRYSDMYGNAGSNVNFVTQKEADRFAVRTYERGVEDETLSCGTGVTAVAIAMRKTGKTNSDSIQLDVEGGKLTVSFTYKEDKFTNVFLKGPAEFVFEGTIKA
ncbi:MAG: diaminopimelate epimerase [Bacteroidota bacterium]